MNIEQLNMNQMFWLQSRHSIPTFEPLIPLQVNIYQMYSRYIDDVPSIIVSLYLGPLSGEIDSKAWDGNLPQIPEGSQSCWFLFWGTSYQVGFSNKLSAIKNITWGTLMILICLFPNWDARCFTCEMHFKKHKIFKFSDLSGYLNPTFSSVVIPCLTLPCMDT